MSERGIKEAIQAVKDVVGSKDCGPGEWIPLNGTPEEVKELRDELINQRGLLKVLAFSWCRLAWLPKPNLKDLSVIQGTTALDHPQGPVLIGFHIY